MACVCGRYNARSDWLTVINAHGPIMGLQKESKIKKTSNFCLKILLLVPYKKQLNNLDRSVVTGKCETSAYRIDFAIARSIRQGLSLRFSRNYRTVEVIK